MNGCVDWVLREFPETRLIGEGIHQFLERPWMNEWTTISDPGPHVLLWGLRNVEGLPASLKYGSAQVMVYCLGNLKKVEGAAGEETKAQEARLMGEIEQ